MRIDGAAVDGEVLCRVDGVVGLRISFDISAVDGQRGLALDALAAFVVLGAVDRDGAAVDGQVAATLDALRVGVVAALTRSEASRRHLLN